MADGGKHMTDWVGRKATTLQGTLTLPGDKSISHRALMLAALADGVSHIRGFLEGEDTRATARVLGQLGVHIRTPAYGERVVHGVGLHGLWPAVGALDCGNSGTGMRLLAGLLAGQAFDSTLAGDVSLSKRPMRRVTEPLAGMGAKVEATDVGTPPLRVHGCSALHGGEHRPQVASAQVKSALLLAGLYADGDTIVHELRPTRDYTERMLAGFGWPVTFAPGEVHLKAGGKLTARDVDVPGDFSSAAFFLVAASIVPGAQLRLEGVGLNPRRTGLLEALRLMGADIVVENTRECAGEPVGDLVVRHAPLHGIEVPEALVPDMIDEFPALFVAAACADGVTTVRGAAELRVKESDRLAVMAEALRTLGIDVDETPDGARITGGKLHGGRVDSRGDHRIAMSAAVAALVADAPVVIADCANVATSFPGFMVLANGCGFDVHDA
ncbi:MAG TPA: 3-phosphoshikimate 1-carboxyvinyltransferase [Rhodanobacteraceae bacterium]